MREVTIRIIGLVLFQVCLNGFAQAEQHFKEVISWRAEKDSVFSNPEISPLLPDHVANFDGLKYFPVNPDFLVLAQFEAAEGEPFAMPTTTARTPMYRVFGNLHFLLSGTEYTLPVYQNLELKNRPGYEDYLFLPFTDLTNAEETYGGGRYIDLRISADAFWEIDFNKSYNPYCAYNSKYSCPIPPLENHLNLRVEAGVLKYDKDY